MMRELNEDEYALLERNNQVDIYDEGRHYRVVKICNSVHYARADFISPGGTPIYDKFVSAPANLNRRVQIGVAEILAFHGYKKPFCFFCLVEELPPYETWEGDHIKKRDDGGEDTPNNGMVLCTRCHKLKHWAETYIRNHIFLKNRGSDPDEINARALDANEEVSK